MFAELVREVEELERANPAGYQAHPSTKRLAAIYHLITDAMPADPGSPAFRQGNTLGKHNRHWFSAGFYERYRLFFCFRSDARVIVYAWVDDEDTLRARGARNDAYAVFRRMLEAGAPPSSSGTRSARRSEPRMATVEAGSSGPRVIAAGWSSVPQATPYPGRGVTSVSSG